MNQLISFYRSSLGFSDYYHIIQSNLMKQTNEFVIEQTFLEGIPTTEKKFVNQTIITKNGNLRIDVPVWFGNLKSSKHRIVVFGLEPRDTNQLFNIEQVNNKVYASPFGVDRWNFGSTIKGKPQNKYYRVFDEIIKQENTFILFSDIVKHYEIIDTSNINGINDENARRNFFSNAEKEKANLLVELELIKPTHIFSLGKGSFEILKQLLPTNMNIFALRHPAHGGEQTAKEQLKQYLLNL